VVLYSLSFVETWSGSGSEYALTVTLLLQCNISARYPSASATASHVCNLNSWTMSTCCVGLLSSPLDKSTGDVMYTSADINFQPKSTTLQMAAVIANTSPIRQTQHRFVFRISLTQQLHLTKRLDITPSGPLSCVPRPYTQTRVLGRPHMCRRLKPLPLPA
jgi:hypothetical protein